MNTPEHTGHLTIRCLPRPTVVAAMGLLLASFGTEGLASSLEELRRFPAAEARQAVAVDSLYVYAIDNHTIGKYRKADGQKVGSWDYEELGIHHLNSGVVVGERLYCAHSNYPKVPMTSSIEIWDVRTIQHVGSHSFGIYEGSATWVDYHDGSWWVCFAHYGKRGSTPGKGPEWTSVVRFDTNWVRREAWVFPESVLERFRPYSASGGAWGPGNLLYCTGHDRPEVYALKLPRAGSTLKLKFALRATFPGQGIAWDPFEPGVLYAIDRGRREVVVLRLKE